MTASIRVCVIPGDDAAPEAMQASLRVLDCLDLPIEWDCVPPGRDLSELDLAERETVVHKQIDAADTVLFGATNGTTPGARYMRWDKLTFANVRPIQWR
ncbi:MAG: hypothetical protein VX823_00115, partial [Actinomycetota bacterium]|nr:hypothetical protein [Actinomycetota bacterium]